MLITCKFCKQIIQVAEMPDQERLTAALQVMSEHMYMHHRERVNNYSKSEDGKLAADVMQCVTALAIVKNMIVSNQEALDTFIDTLLLQIINHTGQVAQRGIYVKLSRPGEPPVDAEAAKGPQNSQGLRIVSRARRKDGETADGGA